MVKHLVIAVLLMTLPAAAATTNHNDDTCDIGLFPAATLLLPYFEVSLASIAGESTLFTVTNVAAAPQVARVTLWTDLAYPVLSFDLYLTGYDVQNISLYDVIVRGQIAPESGQGSDTSPVGDLSGDDNPRLEEQSCAGLPATLPNVIIERVKSALTLGRIPALGSAEACNGAGGVHQNAVGYVTIDVVGACTASLPVDKSYFTHELRYDNVLMGEYVQVNIAQRSAQANPMVHIRAIPEGGEPATRRKTNLPRTFYSRLQTTATRGIDARQPLPSTFAARWIGADAAGFKTLYKIWRESAAGADTACAAYPAASDTLYEVVRFDENENPEVFADDIVIFPLPPPTLPAASLTSIDNDFQFPALGGDVGGWLYLNLHNQKSTTAASQNWVTVSMRADNRFSADFDATPLGNGCSPIAPLTRANQGTGVIGPAPNSN